MDIFWIFKPELKWSYLSVIFKQVFHNDLDEEAEKTEFRILGHFEGLRFIFI